MTCVQYLVRRNVMAALAWNLNYHKQNSVNGIFPLQVEKSGLFMNILPVLLEDLQKRMLCSN